MQNKIVLTRAWISADKESPISDSVTVKITCDSVQPPPPPATTMYKQSDKPVYQKGDTVTYKIAYKQTHGTIITNAADINEWNDIAGNGKFAISKDTVIYNKSSAIMVHKYAFGTNGTFGGTLKTSDNKNDTFSLVARVDGKENVEIKIKRYWGDLWAGVYNSGVQVGDTCRFTYSTFADSMNFNFKVKLFKDTISFWAGDTSSPIPIFARPGIAVRVGFAGVKSNKVIEQTKLYGWNSHFDVAFDLSIRDKLPSVLTYKSAGGSIVKGTNVGKQLSATNNNGDITWPIVSGNETLGAGDSLLLWVKATLDDCTGDTIFNTAYTNIRGYPTDYIGARARATCGEQAKPDHISIILDTVNFSRTSDDILDPIFLGSNQKTYTIFAVVRDVNGNFLRFATNAAWSGGYSQIATISASGDGKWIGVISNVGPGTTMINVNEPGLKADSITVTIMAIAAWPVIKSAVMLDKNGDLTPDSLSITLTADFESSQKLDSVSIEYKGKLYSIPAASVVKQGTNLSVPFTSLSGADGQPSGRVTMYLTVDGGTKQSTKSFIDGVGPALSNAAVLENNGTASDILYLTFSEPIVPSFLKGKQLLLIKAGTTDTTISEHRQRGRITE